MPVSMEIALVALVTAAAWCDVQTRRIPNWITIPAAALGFLMQAVYGGLNGALLSIAGAALGMAIFMALYMFGGMGAGDVKLFAAVGSFVGPRSLILVFVITGILGGIAAVILAVSRGRLRATLERTGELMLHLARLRWKNVQQTTDAAGPDSLRLPYGAVIAGGTLLSLVIVH